MDGRSAWVLCFRCVGKRCTPWGLFLSLLSFAQSFFVPLAWNMAQFCEQKMGIAPEELEACMQKVRGKGRRSWLEATSLRNECYRFVLV